MRVCKNSEPIASRRKMEFTFASGAAAHLRMLVEAENTCSNSFVIWKLTVIGSS